MTGAGPAPLTRIAVVGTGEPALRLIHAVREYRQEHGRDLRVVALHGEDDTDNLWVREADEAVLVVGDGWTDAVSIEQALLAAGVDAVWYGAGSMDAEPVLAECGARLGLARIGAAGVANAPVRPRLHSLRQSRCGA